MFSMGVVFTIFTAICLFSVVDDVEAQCTPGVKVGTYSNPGHWVASGTNYDWGGSLVPVGAWPATHPNVSPNNYASVREALLCAHDFVQFNGDYFGANLYTCDCPGGDYLHVAYVPGSYDNQAGWMRIPYCYAFSVGTLSAHDYDCDGLVDW
jgi:hypothetical protein